MTSKKRSRSENNNEKKQRLDREYYKCYTPNCFGLVVMPRVLCGSCETVRYKCRSINCFNMVTNYGDLCAWTSPFRVNTTCTTHGCRGVMLTFLLECVRF